jgi:hypothetical protein
MSTGKTTPREQPTPRKRLGRDESKACQWLASLFYPSGDYPKPSRSQRQSASFHLTRALKEAGLEPVKPRDWSATRETFRTVVLKLANDGKESRSIEKLKKLSDEYYKAVCAMWAAKRPELNKTSEKEEELKTLRLADDFPADHLAYVGLRPGDTIEGEQVRAPEQDEVVCLMFADGCAFGEFIFLKGGEVGILQAVGLKRYNAEACTIYRPRFVTRREPYIKPSENESPDEAEAMDHTETGTQDRLAPVIQMDAWLSVHPRPIRTQLFADRDS